jgi:peptide/nickel transport system permease protein
MSANLLLETPPDAAPVARKGFGFLWMVIRKQPAATVGAVLLILFTLVAIFGPVIAPYSPHQQIGQPPGCVFAPPSSGHPLGLDNACRDMLSLLIDGVRVSMIIGLAATAIAMLIGSVVGLLAGFYGRGIDTALMRVTDYFLVLPELVLMMILAAIYGSSQLVIVLIIGLILWANTARIIRSQVLSIRERVYVKRAHSIGASNRRIIIRHVLPQVVPLLITTSVLTISVAVFEESAISFLGLGDPSSISLGRVIENAFDSQAISNGAWWAMVPPGILLSLLILSCLLLGQAMEEALNPRLKVSHLSVKSFRVLPARER